MNLGRFKVWSANAEGTTVREGYVLSKESEPSRRNNRDSRDEAISI